MTLVVKVQKTTSQRTTSRTNHPTTKIDIGTVAEQTDIVTLALEYGLDLIQQSNGDYTCLCPFHADNETPSLRIYTSTGTFFCFGCHAGASVFEFVMRMENIEFKDALHKLAAQISQDQTFELRDLKVFRNNHNYSVIKEKISVAILQKFCYIYDSMRKLEAIPLKELYVQCETFWKWYDKIQTKFAISFQRGETPQIRLIDKMYEFYGAAIHKLEVLESKILNPQSKGTRKDAEKRETPRSQAS